MIWIRADANSEIGTGHVMRCLSIAMGLQKLGQEVCFVLADESAVELLQAKGQRYFILHTDYRQMEQELVELLPLLKENEPEVLLVDSYYVTDLYLKQLKEWVKIAYIDDKAMFPYPVDVLINYNVYGEKSFYEECRTEAKQLLLGMQYAPLREEFQEICYQIRSAVENVLITTGGSDKYNLAGQILQQVLADDRIDKLQYHVVCGVFNRHLPMLEELAYKYPNVHIHKNVSRMSELMQQCDVAVSAAGSTMYELCAVGVPIICFSFVDNQEPMVEAFVKKGIVCYGGHYLSKAEAVIADVADNIYRLKSDVNLRLEISKTETMQVDGHGAWRLAKALVEMSSAYHMHVD